MSNKDDLGGIIHTYQKFDPVNFPSPTAPPPDLVSPAFEDLAKWAGRLVESHAEDYVFPAREAAGIEREHPDKERIDGEKVMMTSLESPDGRASCWRRPSRATPAKVF